MIVKGRICDECGQLDAHYMEWCGLDLCASIASIAWPVTA